MKTLKMETEIGLIEAYIGDDEKYPSLRIRVNGKDAAAVDYSSNSNEVLISVWNKEDDDILEVFTFDKYKT